MPLSRLAYRGTLSIAWPSALEAFLVALIAAVDTIMVGSLGAEAISAVGITTQPKFVVLTVIISLNVGVTTIVARRKGERDPEAANRCLRQGILLSTALSLLLNSLAFAFAPQLLVFSGAEQEILADAVLYFRIILVGNFFYSVGLTINAAQRGVGNTKISMVTNLTANGINLIFNYLLIGGNFGFPRWGVMGAAIATALGNFIAFILSFHSILTPKSTFLRL
ncbi:MAG: polysaccharide biosynthesis C-terminal domain-containing protein, partial [Oscillospiraceae bacterium]|nr:polysaccharide biosynthesis C-terminal domain-containing protein [Oscillospiraceae bacterium]